jgi:hypothetical protein
MIGITTFEVKECLFPLSKDELKVRKKVGKKLSKNLFDS